MKIPRHLWTQMDPHGQAELSRRINHKTLFTADVQRCLVSQTGIGYMVLFYPKEDALSKTPGDNRRRSRSDNIRYVNAVAEVCQAGFPEYVVRVEDHLTAHPVRDAWIPHTDAPCGRPTSLADHHRIRAHQEAIASGKPPLSVLVAGSETIEFTVWPYSHRHAWGERIRFPLMVMASTVTIPPYHFCLYRQDLVHQGDGRPLNVFREHFFLDPIGYMHRTRERNEHYPKDLSSNAALQR